MRFGLAGDGRLLDNLGTSTGSRAVQLYNGRARISVQLTGSKASVSVSSEGCETVLCSIAKSGATAAASEKITARPSLDVAVIDRGRILKVAEAALQQAPVAITAFPARLSQGGPHDFYSNGDYWWPPIRMTRWPSVSRRVMVENRSRELFTSTGWR